MKVQKPARVEFVWYDANGDQVVCIQCRLTVLGALGALTSLIGAVAYLAAQWRR